VTLLHPCKKTLLTTSQTIADIYYTSGDPALLTSFASFDDSVAAQYNVIGLCAPVYSLESISDATAYEVTADSAGLYISVHSSNQFLIGSVVTLTLKADSSVVAQDTASSTVTFPVYIMDPCPNTVISPLTTLSNMIYTIAASAATQAITPATDAISTNLSIPSLCGPFTYTLVEVSSFTTVTTSTPEEIKV